MSLFPEAQQLHSAHYNERPTAEVSLLVIHNISLPPRYYGGHYIEDLFLGRLDPDVHPFFAHIDQLQVSAHLCIKRNGQVVQFVPFDKRAWHAGQSSFQGRSQCNDYSIGIELEGCDDHPYTEAQYQALVSVTHYLQAHYPAITLGRIVGHSDIAFGRKTDPGASFDWGRYRSAIHLSHDE